MLGPVVVPLDVPALERPPRLRREDNLRRGLFTCLWVFDFLAGLSGPHTFTGHFFAPCLTAVDCAGSRPNTLKEVLTLTLTVTFS